MILFPHAKINLGLHVLGERPDHYHELRSILYPIGLCDLLEVVSGPSEARSPELTVSGDPTLAPAYDDLTLRAFRELEQLHPLPPPRIHLHKRIPIGAGLGGGSSDAAHLLRHFAQEFGNSQELLDPEGPIFRAAASLGSDIPFFLQDRAMLVSGRGTEMEPFPLDLGGWHLVLIVPPSRISTAHAYNSLEPGAHTPFPEELANMSPKEWRKRLVNDLEKPVFKEDPELEKIKEELYEAGACYASMTGSGSGIYGLFEKDPGPLSKSDRYFEWREELPSLTSEPSNR